jgi:hypothetical protein
LNVLFSLFCVIIPTLLYFMQPNMRKKATLLCGYTLWMSGCVSVAASTTATTTTTSYRTGGRLAGPALHLQQQSSSSSSTSQAEFKTIKAKRNSKKRTASAVLQTIVPFWPFILPALNDPQTRIVEPISQYLQDHMERMNTRHARYQRYPHEALFFTILYPSRILQLATLSFIVSEALNRAGFFDNSLDTNGHRMLSTRLKTTWKNIQSPLLLWQHRIQSWWQSKTWRHPIHSLQRLQPKHQFAVGTTVGVVCGPFVWCVLSRVLQYTSVAYILAEANQYCKVQSDASLVEHVGSWVCITGSVLETVEQTLESVRMTLRNTFRHPRILVGDLNHKLSIVDDIPQDVKLGLVLGIAAGLLM